MALTLNDKYIKDFVDAKELDAIQGEINAAHKMLLDGNGEGSDFLGWIDLPKNYDKEEYVRIKAAAEKIKKSCDVFIVIGIGGIYIGQSPVNGVAQGFDCPLFINGIVFLLLQPHHSEA